MASESGQMQSGATGNVEYAGFWARFAAFQVDWAVTVIAGFVLTFGTTFAGGFTAAIGQFLYVVFSLLYWPYMESSPRQATFGKMLLGIQVTDMDGARVSFVRALLRNLAKIISGLIFYIGFLMAAFTRRKQGLHDIMTKCLVVRTGPSHLLVAILAGVGGLVIVFGGGAAYFYYVYLPQMQQQAASAMQGAMKTAPAVKPKRPSPSMAQNAPRVAAVSKPQDSGADIGISAAASLAGLDKPGTVRVGPAILALDHFFPTSAWVKVHLPLIKGLEFAPAPEVTITSVLDSSGRNYYDPANSFESGIFLRASLSRVPTPAPHYVGQRDVHFQAGLTEKTLHKMEGKLRVFIPSDVDSIMLAAGDTGKEKQVRGTAVALKSLSGPAAVLHYRGDAVNLLGARGFDKDGLPVALESRQLAPRNKSVDMDLHYKFKGPVSRIEVVVAGSVAEEQFPFSLVRGASAGAGAAVATATPSRVATSRPAPAPSAAARAKPAARAPAPARKEARPMSGTQAQAQAKAVPKTQAPARVARMEGEVKAKATPAPEAPPAPPAAAVYIPPSSSTAAAPKFNDVMTAVVYEDEAAVEQLLDLGWWVDKPGSNGYTPLMAAVMRRNARIAQMLLAHGADPNARGPAGVTPLALAQERNDSGMSALLQKQGAQR